MVFDRRRRRIRTWRSEGREGGKEGRREGRKEGRKEGVFDAENGMSLIISLLRLMMDSALRCYAVLYIYIYIYIHLGFALLMFSSRGLVGFVVLSTYRYIYIAK